MLFLVKFYSIFSFFWAARQMREGDEWEHMTSSNAMKDRLIHYILQAYSQAGITERS